MSKIFNKVFLVLGIFLTLALILSWFASGIDPRRFWLAAFWGLMFPYFFLIAIPFSLIGLLMKNHKTWLLVLILIGTSGLFRKSFINFSPRSEQKGGIKVMTHNVGSSIEGNMKPEWKFYKSQQADILCFQEWVNGPGVKSIRDSIETNYSGTLKQALNQWPIFSKHPILRQGELKSAAKGNGCTWADIVYHRDTVRIYNVHLVSNRISAQTEQLLHTTELPDKTTLQKVTRVMRRYKQALLLRVNQADDIKKHISRSPYPVILAGDFNDTPSSFVYNLLGSQLKDAFMQAGNSLAYTYAGRLPFLNIDHILISPALRCSAYEINRINYSDHFPVTGKFYFHP